MHSLKRAAAAFVPLAIALLLLSGVAHAGSEFVGTWKLEGTTGEPFQITLSEGGHARGRYVDKELKGAWSEEDGAATVTWGTGWYTKIFKDGDGYKKSVFKGSLDTPAISTSTATKID
jgi:hypothetical protein